MNNVDISYDDKKTAELHKELKVKILENGKIEIIFSEKKDKDPVQTNTLQLDFNEFYMLKKRMQVKTT